MPKPADSEVEWTLPDLFAVFARRRIWILASFVLSCGAAALYWTCATPRYRATAVIEIQKESHGAFGLDNATSDRPTTALSDSFDDNLTLQTQVGVLTSDALTLGVIRRAGLETTTDYFAPGGKRVFPLQKLFFWRKPLEPLSTPLADAPNRRSAALRIFAHHRKIAPQAGTRLITVSYTDPDPARAATVVNSVVQELADYEFQSRSAAAAQSASWLSGQLAGLRRQTDALDARAAALDSVSGDYGEDDSHNVVLARLDALNTALSTAESNRIVREAIWRAVESGNPEALSGLAGSPNAGPNTQNSLALLQSLRSQESALQSQIAESTRRYGESWPALVEQRAQLTSVQDSIQEEIHRLGNRVRTDYDVAVLAENGAHDAFTQQKKLASQLTGKAASLRLARQEAEESRALYTSLLGRLQQTGILGGLHSGDFAVVSPALVPPPNQPASPNVPLLSACALGVGTLVGCAAALARELTDTAIRTPSDLETLLDAPVFAAIPRSAPEPPWFRRILPVPARSGVDLQASNAPDVALPLRPTAFVEALYRLRASLLVSHSRRAPQVILVTDPRPHPSPVPRALFGSAPPSLALNLAAVLAQHGSSVLYVDADLRTAPESGTTGDPGLSEMLANEAVLPFTQSAAGLPLLSIIAAGERSPCASELIASSRMASLLAAWREEFRFIVIHGSAAVFADALVLAQLSDAVLLSAQAGKTSRADVLPAYQALSRQIPDDAVLGLVLEHASPGRDYAHA